MRVDSTGTTNISYYQKEANDLDKDFYFYLYRGLGILFIELSEGLCIISVAIPFFGLSYIEVEMRCYIEMQPTWQSNSVVD